jgi:adenylate cyclase
LISRFLTKLHQRGLFKAGAAYIVSCWAIAKVAELTINKFQAPDWAMQWVLIVLFAGFPLVLVATWFFDFQAIELNFEDGDGEVEKPEAALGSAMPAATIFAPDENSIAVLPFVNMSADPENEYFADGLSEELLNLLARIPELKVCARTSSFAFKNKNEDIRNIAQKLNVAHILEGSVRKASASVRVTAQLIQTSDGYHVWSETFDRKLDDIFAVQDEISVAVVDTLKISLLGEKPHCFETDPAAFALQLKGNQLLEQHVEGSLDRAMEAFQQALALDPNYPAAQLGVARVHIGRVSNGSLAAEEGIPAARDLVNRALATAPNCPDANSSSAFLAGLFEGDWPVALQAAERALTIAPGDARVTRRLAPVIAMTGDSARSIELAQQSVAVDPLNASGFHNLGVSLYISNRMPEARAAFREALKLADTPVATRSMLGFIALLEDNPALALAEVADDTDLLHRDAVTIMARHTMGETEAAARAMDAFIAQYGDYSAYDVATIYAYTGQTEAAFEWLQKAIENSCPELNTMAADQLFRNLFNDPRWLALQKETGYSARAAG